MPLPLEVIPANNIAHQLDINISTSVASVSANWDVARGRYIMKVEFEYDVNPLLDNRIGAIDRPFPAPPPPPAPPSPPPPEIGYAVYMPGDITNVGMQTPQVFFRENGSGNIELLVSNIPVNVAKGRHAS